ncbi:DUF5403 family protein [Actinocorallia libanotica]|uniref:Uncharacterized protein n=1 Tax=Actinocorallia libanotica TaxID=46162 RepID=A0ABP4CEI6_9ACTN
MEWDRSRQKLNKHIATIDGVQEQLEEVATEISERAEDLLAMHHFAEHAEILLLHGDVDWYVALSDDRGRKAALSIEYGRKAGSKKRPDGTVVTWSDMDGLYILADASRLPRKRKGKVVL